MDARDKYLDKHYGISSVEYAQRALLQGGACACCGQVPTGKPLHVDHDHSVANTKVKVKQISEGAWVAGIERFNQLFEGTGRAEVLARAKKWLLRKSVRGLLCWKCNEGMRSFKNRSDVMRSGADYIDAFKASLAV